MAWGIPWRLWSTQGGRILTRLDSFKGHSPKSPRYTVIRDILRDSILDRRIAPDLVLLEGQIARLFGTSRGPVRKALELLHQEGVISRFEGRGFLATPDPGSVVPARDPLTPGMLRLNQQETAIVDQRSVAERIYYDVENAVATCIAFGHFRIIETTLSDYYGVSRTVAREVLGRLRNQRLVEKGARSHWLAGPLTSQAVLEDYEIRVLLEPAALRASAPLLARQELLEMQSRLQRLVDDPTLLNTVEIAHLENDLHRRCLRHYRNRKAAEMIAQSQLPILVNRLFFQSLGVPPSEPMVVEHRLVIDHLLYGAFDAAASSLESHLLASSERTRSRLKVLSVFPEPDLPAWLNRIS